MLWLLIIVALACWGTRAGRLDRRAVVSTSYKDTTNGADFGSLNTVTTLNSDVTVWLSGADPHDLRGNINVYGELILSQTDYTGPRGGMDSDYTGTNTQNGNLFIAAGGIISVNDWQSTNDAGYIWHIYTFTNNGTLQWCGRSQGSGSDFSLHCEVNCYNYGLIDWGQYNGYNSDLATEWENDNKQPPSASTIYYVYNYGAFRLTNIVFYGRQNIYGDGCWILGEHGVLYLVDTAGYYQNPTAGPTYPGQIIYFSQTTSTLHLDSQTYTINPNFGPQIYGFGTGKAIEFEETIRSYSYNTGTGVLTVLLATANHPVYLKIGLGYVSGSFSTGNNPTSYSATGFNAIFYALAPPVQAIPSKCIVSAPTCTDPALTARRFGLTTSTSTSSAAPTYVTTSVQYTGTGIISAPLTTTISPSGTAPGTIVVVTPASYTTTTVPYTGTATLATASTSTVAPSGTNPGTIVIYTPIPYATRTTVYTGPGTIAAPSTSTVAQTGTTPGTIVIYTPGTFVTITAVYSGPGVITTDSTSTVAPSGTAPGTVVIYTPAYLTSTAAYTGPGIITAPTTSTLPPSGTTPGYIVIYTPASYVTTTATYSGPGVITAATTSTVPPSGTAPGTIVIYSPAYLTSTAAYTGPGVITAPTTSTVPPTGTTPGYIVIFTPASYITTTETYSGPGVITAATTSTVPPSGTEPGTVVVYTPAYSTSTAAYTGPGVITAPTTSTVGPSGTNPGYVVIYTPAAYVTTTQPYTGTGQINSPFTATIAPSGTQPGTVVIYTPATTVTSSTRPASITTTIASNSCFCTAV